MINKQSITMQKDAITIDKASIVIQKDSIVIDQQLILADRQSLIDRLYHPRPRCGLIGSSPQMRGSFLVVVSTWLTFALVMLGMVRSHTPLTGASNPQTATQHFEALGKTFISHQHECFLALEREADCNSLPRQYIH